VIVEIEFDRESGEACLLSDSQIRVSQS